MLPVKARVPAPVFVNPSMPLKTPLNTEVPVSAWITPPPIVMVPSRLLLIGAKSSSVPPLKKVRLPPTPKLESVETWRTPPEITVAPV